MINFNPEFNPILASPSTLQEAIDNSRGEVNRRTGAKILAAFDDTKQRNMIARWCQIEEIRSLHPENYTATIQAEQDALRNAWLWVGVLRGASNVARLQMLQATSIEAVNALMTAFIAEISAL